jgi:iron complex outermembrane receptor protein
MRPAITSAFILISAVVCGQMTEVKDTISIKEILVKGSAVSPVIKGYRKSSVDTAVIKDHSLDDLSDIVSEGTPVFVKSYGPSGASTISFRGSGASHTQLLWNDLSINSPMLGQADLSLIPGGFVDEISVFSGGASMAAGSGGLGGLLSIKTRPDWKNNDSFLLNAGIGSFGRYTSLVKLRTGGAKFQSVTRAFTNTAINDFQYTNPVSYAEPVTEFMKNSEVLQSSIMQDFYIRGNKSVTSISAWYSYADRNLPSNMLVPQQNGAENQVDNTLRALISHNRYLDKGGFESTVAWFSEYLRYTNPQAGIDSRNRSNTLFFKEVLQIPAGNRLDLKVMLLDEINLVNSINYDGFRSRNLLTLSASARREIGERLGVVLLFRELLVNDKFITPDYSAAIDFELVKNSGSFLKMNFSRNSKVPTMNDLFWNPGGNPDLSNEYSYSGEISVNILEKTGDHSEFNADLTLYTSRIRDMIQWKPGSMSYWTPENIASVGASGIETGFGYNYVTNLTAFKVSMFYSYNRSENLDPEKEENMQLIYVPEHQLNGSIRAAYRNFSSSISGSFTGKRYTTTDNSESLPGYVLLNLGTGYSFRLNRSWLDLTFRVDNILKKQYEVIAWYPMPGRSCIFSVTYRFAKR